ncbi:hypothetical protein DPMN_151765, partial [Dreissena polymorpha]
NGSYNAKFATALMIQVLGLGLITVLDIMKAVAILHRNTPTLKPLRIVCGKPLAADRAFVFF